MTLLLNSRPILLPKKIFMLVLASVEFDHFYTYTVGNKNLVLVLSRMLQADYNSPSIHNFSTSVSIFAVMIPTESPMRTKKPTTRTTQQFRREKHPSLKKMA